MQPRALIVIPARMGSSRFPGKPLASIAGVTMLERVWSIGKAVGNASQVVIATDHVDIEQHAKSFGAEVVMTSAACRTGTDRVAEVATKLADSFDIVFSFQGDSALTPPWVIEETLAEMLADPSVQIATPAVALRGEALERFVSEKARGSTTGTTVVFSKTRNALYFSKALLPNRRDKADGLPPVFLHIGLYGYRSEVLQRFAMLPQGALEEVEQLEQLRALEHDIPIRVVVVDTRGRTLCSVD
ncbi:MAG: 3-deoxy-manno-octulosonate cytidylyltransferase, partial [Bdellovibrionales bacterium]|nr:3-deoxy-manno-octulosonate cytidylyltransferase [Bdellovibrionales bacterium]